MSFEDFFSDNQFDRIIFFLRENGYDSIEKLEHFNFDDLYFVPNVTDMERTSFIERYSQWRENQAMSIPNEIENVEINENDNLPLVTDTKSTQRNDNAAVAIKSSPVAEEIKSTVNINSIEDWIYSYPVRMIERALKHKVKPSIPKYNTNNNIFSVSDFLEDFPEELSGISQNALDQYTSEIESIVNNYEKLSEKEFLNIYGERNWEDYYSQIPAEILINSMSPGLLNASLFSLLNEDEIKLSGRAKKILKGTQLRFFIINGEFSEKGGITKKSKAIIIDNVLKNLFPISTKDSFITHKELFSGKSSIIKNIQLDIELPICSEYSNISGKQLDLFDQFEGVRPILERYNYHFLSDIKNEELTYEDYSILKDKLSKFNLPLQDDVDNIVNSLTQTEKDIMIYRGIGETLESIGTLVNLTRERVRQIEKKVIEKVQDELSAVILYLLDGRNYFLEEDLAILLETKEEETSSIIIYSMKKYDSMLSYISQIDRYYLKDIIDINNCYESLKKIALEYGYLDELYDAFMKSDSSIENLDVATFSSLLSSFGKYKTSGNIYYLRSLSANEFYGEVIKRYFPNGIKTTQSLEFNDDLNKLIRITKREFPFVEPSSTARSFSTLLNRNQKLILSGRGELTHISNTYIDDGLLQEIKEFIFSSEKPSLFYKEIYEIFSGKIQMLSSITNYNYLHGILYYYFKDEFDFVQRDQITKLGEEIEPIDIRVQKLLEKNGRMYVNEIVESIPGISSYQIQFADERNSDIFNVDYGMYASVNSLKNKDEIQKIGDTLIEMIAESSKGYVSASQLFNRIQSSIPDFIHINKLSERGLLNLLKNQFPKSARYRYPHIVDRNKYGEDRKLNTSQLLWYLFGEEGTVTEDQLESLSQEYQWSLISINGLIKELGEEMYRVGNYSYSMDLEVNEKNIEEIDTALQSLLTFEYRSLQSITDFSSFVDIGFEWNGNLIETFIRYFSKKFRLIERENTKLHTLSSIFVKIDSELHSYEDAVIFVLKKAGYHSITEYELQRVLVQNGLTNVKVPNELKNGEKIKYSPRLEIYEVRE